MFSRTCLSNWPRAAHPGELRGIAGGSCVISRVSYQWHDGSSAAEYSNKDWDVWRNAFIVERRRSSTSAAETTIVCARSSAGAWRLEEALPCVLSGQGGILQPPTRGLCWS